MTASFNRSADPAPRHALLGPNRFRPSTTAANINLALELAIASFKLKYAGSLLGYVWTLVKPLTVFGMMYVLFALFLLRGRTSPGENFPVELLVGIVLWTFFADATSASLQSIVLNGDMVRKAYFPRWILVVATVTSAAMTLLVNLTLLFGAGLLLHWFQLSARTLTVIPLLSELVVVAVGIGMLLSAGYVFFRDLTHIWDVALQALFFSSAIVFPLSLLSPFFARLIMLNPIAQIITDMRHALISPDAPWASTIAGALYFVPLFLSSASLIIGSVLFRRLSKRFGEAI